MWGERDPAKLDFVGLVLPKVGLNKNFSSVSIFRNFPFLSGISFLSFWAVHFFRNLFCSLEYLFLGELFSCPDFSYRPLLLLHFLAYQGLLFLEVLLVG